MLYHLLPASWLEGSGAFYAFSGDVLLALAIYTVVTWRMK